MYRLKRNKVILAFPGMGKTPLSYKRSNYRDVDFGTYRAGRGVAKEAERSILPEFANYINELDKQWQGTTIMSNEPKLMDYLWVDRVYLPDPSVLKYSAKKLGVDEDTIAEWVQDWAEIAARHGFFVRYLKVGLDDYLIGKKVRKHEPMLPMKRS